MGFMDALMDVAELGLPQPFSTLAGLEHTLKDGSAAAFDYATGDTDHGNEHLKDVGWDLAGLIPGAPGKIANTAHFMKDAGGAVGLGKSATEEEAPDEDPGGDGAGWGALLGLTFGGPLGVIPGAIAGGIINSNAHPTAHGGFLDPNLALQAATLASTNGSKPPPPPVLQSLEENPYSHYAD